MATGEMRWLWRRVRCMGMAWVRSDSRDRWSEHDRSGSCFVRPQPPHLSRANPYSEYCSGHSSSNRQQSSLQS
eukprot:6050946-Pleurochrysis_carterae.AAC.1